MRPRIVRSPVDICLGTSPSQAEKSRPLANAPPLPIAAIVALEMIGPMPGTVMTLRQLSSLFANVSISSVTASIRSSSSPNLDFLRSFTRAGVTTIFVNLKGSTPAKEVPDIWYHVRKSVGDIRRTLPPGVVGPGFNDQFGDTFGIIYGFTADGFTHRELRDYVENIRARLLGIADVSKIEVLGAQDERIIIEFSTEKLAGLGIDRASLIAAIQAQNAVSPAGTLDTSNETLLLRVSGAFESERDLLALNIASNGRLLRLSDIATVRRVFVDPPQPIFRINGRPGIGLAIAMRDGGDILALGQTIRRTMTEVTADLPIGIESALVADQSSVVQAPSASSWNRCGRPSPSSWW
jgi:multidrug efflux pump subunit AcrB